jgi:hypothetical protein
MMVSLLLYAYARGERSSRGIERKCVEDVAYRVIAAQYYHAQGRDKQGRRLGCPPKPYEPPEIPAGKINTTDLDSRNVKTPRSYTQGYNAQAAVNDEQIVLATEVTASSPDFDHLEPMIKATKKELQKVGVTETPRRRGYRLGVSE